jgi:formate-nitrite transporter family protein
MDQIVPEISVPPMRVCRRRLEPVWMERDGGRLTDGEEQEEVQRRSSPSGKIVYESVMKEAHEELSRSSMALFWSALAAGGAMGFSVLAEATLQARLPQAPWAELVSKLGYAFGFLVVILGRQQLFTENTLTPILPLLRHREGATLANVARLWGVVLVGNMLGALLIGLVLARSSLLPNETHAAAVELGRAAMSPSFGTVVLRGIFAGWLIAILVWMLPYAESSHFWVILTLTWLVGVLHLSHVVAGGVAVFTAAWTDHASFAEAMGRFIVPSLMGNIFGGVALVAALNHAQVVSGERT